MCRVAWEVSDGRNEFIVTFSRSDVEGPRQYSILRGHIVVEREFIDVDADALHQVIDEALYPHAAPLRKIRALVDWKSNPNHSAASFARTLDLHGSAM